MPTVLDQLLTHVVRKDLLDEKDPYGWAPLRILAQNKAHDTDKCHMMSMLIDADADPNVRGNRGATPLFKAAATAASRPQERPLMPTQERPRLSGRR